MAETDGILDQVQLHRVDSLDQLDQFRRWLSQPRQLLCADTESAGLNIWRDRHRLTQVGYLWAGWTFGQGWAGAAHEVLTRYNGRVGWYNSPYDHQVLEHWCGVRPRWEATDDAQLAAHIHDSQRINKLKPRAAIEIDRRAAHFDKALHDGMAANKWTFATVPESWEPYWQYAAMDPVLTAHLLAKFLPVVRGQFSHVYDLELAYAQCCADMMTAGMMIDRPYIHEWMRRVTEWSAPAAEWLAREWGVTNPGSNEQVGHALDRAQVPILHRTPTGKPKADKDTLQVYAAMYPEASHLIGALINVKKAESIITRCFAKFLDLAGPDDVIHYSIHSTGAQRTGRSSVTEPPMQTFDRDVPQIRGCFRPRPGHVFISWDYDQIEARLAAHFSGDRQLIADLAEADATGQSFFLIQAAGIYGEQITKRDKRYTTTKNAFYGWQFGAGLQTAAATAGVSVDQMRPAYEGIQERYQGVQRMMNRIVRENRRANHRPQVRTAMGKRLYVDRGKEYSGQDYTIQGTAAEILKTAVVTMKAQGYGQYLRLTHHDEVFAEVPAADAQDVLRAGTEIMTDRVNWRVPLTCSGTILEERWVKA